MASDPVTAVATLLSQVFGFVVDPTGLEQMKLEHEIELIHAGVKIAQAKHDTAAVDVLLGRYRELSKRLSA